MITPDEFLKEYTARYNDTEYRPNSKLDKQVWKAFVIFFKEVQGHDDWTEEEINMSYNKDDLIDFIEYIRQSYQESF